MEVVEGPKTKQEHEQAVLDEAEARVGLIMKAMFEAGKAAGQAISGGPDDLVIATWNLLRIQFMAMRDVANEPKANLSPDTVSSLAQQIVGELVANVIAPVIIAREELKEPHARA